MCPLSNEDLREVVIQSCTVVQPVYILGIALRCIPVI